MSANKRSPIGDRLLPALLDRLIDDEPAKRTEAEYSRSMNRGAYRQSVLRDMRWLFNAVNAEAEIDFEGFPQAQNSTINFGLPGVAGQRFSELDWIKIENMMRDAVVRFEPRVLPDSVEVKAITSADTTGHHNLLAFEIRGQLWSEPYPLDLLLRSQIDLESGVVSVTDNSEASA
ncbi:MAG: type VI secretion system baseplate subunit TssE [Casimicrobium sp.]